MAFTAETGDHKVTRSDIFLVDPEALVVDWRKNLSRNGEEPPVDEALKDLARDMLPRKGQGDTEEGTSGQIHPILVRPLSDRRLEVIGGFRRMRAALWLKASGSAPTSRSNTSSAVSPTPRRHWSTCPRTSRGKTPSPSSWHTLSGPSPRITG